MPRQCSCYSRLEHVRRRSIAIRCFSRSIHVPLYTREAHEYLSITQQSQHCAGAQAFIKARFSVLAPTEMAAIELLDPRCRGVVSSQCPTTLTGSNSERRKL